MTEPINVTHEQLAAIQSASYALPTHERAEFLTVLANRLRGIAALGDGLVYRELAAVQLQFSHPTVPKQSDENPKPSKLKAEPALGPDYEARAARHRRRFRLERAG